MKISVCGKGGSGKSVVTTLLATAIRNRGYQVIVVDSDESNSGLFRLLGFDKPPVPLLELVGGKQHVKNVFPRTPLTESDGEMNVLGRSQLCLGDLPPQHSPKRDGISLVSVGKILQALEGCACPMGVLSREFLKKLQLKPDEAAIVDMEAGVEHFGRGVETGIDSVLLVVDPSYESLELAGRVKGLSAGAGVRNTWAVLNKVPSDDIASRLEEELRRRDVNVIGRIPYDPAVFEACLQGRPLQPDGTAQEIAAIVDVLLRGSAEDGEMEDVTSPNSK